MHKAKSARSGNETTSADVKSRNKLAFYRTKSAAMVHKASGDSEEACKDGLAVFEALSPARSRANKTAPNRDDE